ncbi:MAG: PorT family protein [Pseudoflavonifractor sp.]|nr:PorT family protein [Pseudoflavonifractor sp.]
MLKSLRRAALVLALAVAAALPASAQFHFGVKLGTEVTSLKFNKGVFDPSNRAGFTGGVMAEIMIPLTNVGFDASVMYVHRTSTFETENIPANEPNSSTMVESKIGGDYIEIPINFKWKIGIPVVGKFVAPYLFTGPSFSFLTSKKAISDAYRNKKFDSAWNFGIGLELLSKVQIGASYGLGMSDAFETIGVVDESVKINGKNNYWTITAAFLF